MTLTDTGPLVALLDKGDARHEDCVSALAQLPVGGMITTWPCLTEIAHLIWKRGGWPAIENLIAYLHDGKLMIYHLGPDHLERIVEAMIRYRDLPCDLADASLLATAEALGLARIFTLDSHFYAYRLADGTAFEVFPRSL